MFLFYLIKNSEHNEKVCFATNLITWSLKNWDEKHENHNRLIEEKNAQFTNVDL